ncbi:hypothetical protein [Stenotrophomonas maltophilia]|uniref:hypothetical protein n=1 Tax=Stenotrophomonas maltophilia TaxID=40324 RepID=UPI000DA85EC7|nr:hypothetical protein [Stenotrophomonas maltophilia]PZS96341.1 hypothetical protein A7X66_09240 [Stenotrophomonas maltophilia]
MNLEQIDTSTTAGKAEVMRLAAEGRRVAAFLLTQPTAKWGEVDEPVWDWYRTQYAIIAEPVGPDEVWVGVADNGSVVGVGTTPAAISTNRIAVRYIRADLAGEKG